MHLPAIGAQMHKKPNYPLTFPASLPSLPHFLIFSRHTFNFPDFEISGLPCYFPAITAKYSFTDQQKQKSNIPDNKTLRPMGSVGICPIPKA